MATTKASSKVSNIKEISTKAKQAPKPEPEAQEDETLRSKYARAAVQVRWAGEKATDEELRAHVRKLDRQAMMTYLDKLRHACEVVAQEVNQRLCEETPETKCETCRGDKKGGQWRMLKTERDRNSGTLRNFYFCSDVCIVLWNQKQTGVAGISDRGMSRGSAMPDEVPAKRIVEQNTRDAARMAKETNAAARTMPDRGTVVRAAAKANAKHAGA